MNYTYFYKTNIGRIGITENGTAITSVFFCDDNLQDTDCLANASRLQDTARFLDTSRLQDTSCLNETTCIKETPLLQEAATQLSEYFAGNRTAFNIPMSPTGTAFQKKVWQVLQTIPYGETWSYKKVAMAIGNPNASRAVGMANNKNPIAIIVPCHRVIGANGKLVGYAGGLDIKSHLLQLEQLTIKNK